MDKKQWAGIASVALFAAACTTGLGNFFLGGAGVEPSGLGEFSEAGLGFDPGFELAVDSDVALTGALIPGVTTDEDRRIAFFAFSTPVPADDADGSGTPLARDAVTPLDTNGASDIFLAAVVSTDVTVNGTAVPTGFGQGLVNVFRHSRCANCHAMGHDVLDTPVFDPLGPGHAGPAQPIDTVVGCSECHTETVFGETNPWQAPLQANADQLGGFDLRFRSVTELNARALQDPTGRSFAPFSVIDPEGAVQHLKTSPQVNWAITRGIVPTSGATGPDDMGVLGGSSPNTTSKDIGPVPITREEWEAMIDAWQMGGFQVGNERAVKDVTLVSRAAGGGTPMAGAGSSVQPSITFMANGAYDPAAPDPEVPVGWVYAAYVSDAADLVAGGSSDFHDVYRSRVAVHLDTVVDPIDPTRVELIVDLRTVTDETELISVSAVGPQLGGDADSSRPFLGPDGMVVAYQSLATDQLVGFVDGNGADEGDVFLRDLASGMTSLGSPSTGNPLGGGDGASAGPRLSSIGNVLTFESHATDLVALDNNTVADVFYARYRDTGFDPLARASVVTGGSEAIGGDSLNASAYFFGDDVDTDVFITYESAKNNLVVTTGGNPLPGLPASNVYLFDSRDGGTTFLLSQSNGGEAADGPSSSPLMSPNGDAVIFETTASNLDGARSADGNDCADVMLVDLGTLFATGAVQTRRLSISSIGEDGNGNSSAPLFGAFQTNCTFDDGLFVGYATEASNLGASPNSPHVLSFLQTVGFPTISAFTADVVEGLIPLTVNFEDRSLGGVTDWAWDFGDPGSGGANASTLEDPSHTYNDVGTYDVQLVVDGDTGQDTEQKITYVTAHPPTVVDFQACDNAFFIGCDLSDFNPFQVFFRDLTVGDPQSWFWNFGDFSTSTLQNPTHTYFNAGTYTVSLTVTGPFAGEGPQVETKTSLITVVQSPTPVANFSVDPTVCEDDSITFTSLSTPDANITSLTWNFGDGTGNFVVNSCSNFSNCTINHTFSNSGDYNVTLTASGPGGSNMISKPVEVAENSITFATVQNILQTDHDPGVGNNACVGCHSTFDDFNGSGLINVASSLTPCSTPGFRILVVPGNPDSSLLYQKVTSPPCGSSMPTTGPGLSASEIANLRDWIICLD